MAERMSEEPELASAIAQHGPDIEAGFLIGYVVVAEWIDSEGNRWLTRRSATGQGEYIPAWQMRGYLNEALNHWPELEPEEEAEE